MLPEELEDAIKIAIESLDDCIILAGTYEEHKRLTTARIVLKEFLSAERVKRQW